MADLLFWRQCHMVTDIGSSFIILTRPLQIYVTPGYFYVRTYDPQSISIQVSAGGYPYDNLDILRNLLMVDNELHLTCISEKVCDF